MIQELKLCKEDYEELLVNYLKHLLIMLHRLDSHKPKGKNRLLMEEMDSAVRYFHENYTKAISIEEYATEHHMSISWFIRNFKEYTEATPTQYIQSLRISNAQTLLETTNYNVSEIAQILGYDDPFTLVGFSRSKADCRLQNFANNFSRILKIRLVRPDLKLSTLCLTFEIFMCNIFFSKIISVFSRTHFIHFLEHPIKRPLTLESCIQANIGNGFV